MAEEIKSDASTDISVSVTETKALVILLPPARFERVDWLSFISTTLIALTAYLFTLAPNVTLEWSGINSVGAMYGGVLHPPGYPVWTIYSWCFIELLPFSNIAWRVAVGSAVASAVACGLVALMVSRCGLVLLHNTPYTGLKKGELAWLRIVCGSVAGLVLAFSDNVWRYAVIAEIRAVSLLLFVVILGLFVRWALVPEQRRYLLGAYFVFGLLLTGDQEFIVLLPGLVLAVMLADAKVGRDMAFFTVPLVVASTTNNGFYVIWAGLLTEFNLPILGSLIVVLVVGLTLIIRTRHFGSEWLIALLCGLCFLAGLGFYLYLPIASMTTPPVNWGYPRTAEGFWHVIGRGQYESVRPTTELRRFAGQSWDLLMMTGKQFGWLYLALALLPFSFVHRLTNHSRRLLAGFAVIWLCVTFLTLVEINPPPDRQAWQHVGKYFAASHSILAVWFGLGLMIVGARFAAASQAKLPAAASTQSPGQHKADDSGSYRI